MTESRFRGPCVRTWNGVRRRRRFESPSALRASTPRHHGEEPEGLFGGGPTCRLHIRTGCVASRRFVCNANMRAPVAEVSRPRCRPHFIELNDRAPASGYVPKLSVSLDHSLTDSGAPNLYEQSDASADTLVRHGQRGHVHVEAKSASGSETGPHSAPRRPRCSGCVKF